jgi:hypothetical protein
LVSLVIGTAKFIEIFEYLIADRQVRPHESDSCNAGFWAVEGNSSLIL